MHRSSERAARQTRFSIPAHAGIGQESGASEIHRVPRCCKWRLRMSFPLVSRRCLWRRRSRDVAEKEAVGNIEKPKIIINRPAGGISTVATDAPCRNVSNKAALLHAHRATIVVETTRCPVGTGGPRTEAVGNDASLLSVNWTPERTEKTSTVLLPLMAMVWPLPSKTVLFCAMTTVWVRTMVPLPAKVTFPPADNPASKPA